MRRVVIGSVDAVGVDRFLGVSVDGRGDSITLDERSFLALAMVPGSILLAAGEDFLDVEVGRDHVRRLVVSPAVAQALKALLEGG